MIKCIFVIDVCLILELIKFQEKKCPMFDVWCIN